MTDHAKSDVDSGVYEKRYTIKPGDRVVDIGAHVGHFTMHALDVVGSGGFVLAVEPHPVNLKSLKTRTANLSSVAIVDAAAWDWNGQIVLHHCNDNDGAHSLVHQTNGPMLVVECVDIGELLKSFAAFNFIKIDAEGAEYHILKSLLEHGIRCPMAVEIHSDELYAKCAHLCLEYGIRLEIEGSNPVGVNYIVL